MFVNYWSVMATAVVLYSPETEFLKKVAFGGYKNTEHVILPFTLSCAYVSTKSIIHASTENVEILVA